MTEPRPTPASPPQRFTSTYSTPTGVALGGPRRLPAPAIPGSRTPDHFDLYREVTAHCSTASPQVRALVYARRR